ncbi:MAG: winged helix-turn-helix transcriptional regulator [Chloroflexi bacterium]|nr:winged helix-turn-helix transcriptional regulator [Chloroflexota bacterium]
MDEQTEIVPEEILWDIGTAYDFFISLRVLHKPNQFGLRGAWAAGVRSRLPAADKEFLEKHAKTLQPLHWIYNLPQPKDADTVLYALKQLTPIERMSALFLHPVHNKDNKDFFLDLAERGSWEEKDKTFLQNEWADYKDKATPAHIEDKLDSWARAGEMGNGYLSALLSYFEVFFAEEENRIRPKLEAGLKRAQELADEAPVADLLEELFQGLRFVELANYDRLILAPSFWSTPIVFYSDLDENSRILTFGSRPPEDSLVPGEVVPDAVLKALKALSDPTRLRILRYLVREHLAPAELSRRLRLRAPTVTHHLLALRLAGLVGYTYKSKNELLYSARLDTVTATYISLKAFLEESSIETEPSAVPERGRAV